MKIVQSRPSRPSSSSSPSSIRAASHCVLRGCLTWKSFRLRAFQRCVRGRRDGIAGGRKWDVVALRNAVC